MGSAPDQKRSQDGFGGADWGNYPFCKSGHRFPVRILPVAIGGGTFVHLPLFIARNEKSGLYKTLRLPSTLSTVRSERLKFTSSGWNSRY